MLFFVFNDTATTEIYTLSLHDALPIYLVNLTLLLGIFSVWVALLIVGGAALELYEWWRDRE